MTISNKTFFTSLMVASSVLFVGCSHTNTSMASNQTQPATTEKHVNSDNLTKSESSKEVTTKQAAPVEKKVDSTVKTTTTKTESSNVQTKKVPVSSLTFHVEEKDNYTPESPSGWKPSPSSQFQVTIDGRGINSEEEGQGSIVVENKNTSHSTIYSLSGTIGNSLTPKYAEWKNDHILYVIMGYPYGTISKGGNLYELNIDTHDLTPVIDNLPKKEEIISVYKNSNNTFVYKKNVYEDDNFTKSHIVEGQVPEVQK
jgi:hypothetical protein